jgi:hypothetical protein
VEAELDCVRRRNEGKQESLRERRGRVAKRRANLRKSQEEEEKVSFPSKPQDISAGYEPESKLITSLRTRMEAQRREDHLVQAEIRAARKVLVKEVVDVFGVRPCRPLNGNEVKDVDGCRVGKGDGIDFGREELDMEIAGLRFPSPGGFTGKPVLLSSLSNFQNDILNFSFRNLHRPGPRTYVLLTWQFKQVTTPTTSTQSSYTPCTCYTSSLLI